MSTQSLVVPSKLFGDFQHIWAQHRMQIDFLFFFFGGGRQKLVTNSVLSQYFGTGGRGSDPKLVFLPVPKFYQTTVRCSKLASGTNLSQKSRHIRCWLSPFRTFPKLLLQGPQSQRQHTHTRRSVTAESVRSTEEKRHTYYSGRVTCLSTTVPGGGLL